jgi:hypothetical protein
MEVTALEVPFVGGGIRLLGGKLASRLGLGVQVTRSVAQKKSFLKLLAANDKTPSWMKQWLKQGKVPPGYEVDHIKPLSIGGVDLPSNMRLILKLDHILHHKRYHPWR